MEAKFFKVCVDEFAEDGSIYDNVDIHCVNVTSADVITLCQSIVEDARIDAEDSIPSKAKDSYTLKIETNTDGYDFVIAVYSSSDKDERKLYNGYHIIEDVLPERGTVLVNVM